MARSIIDKVFPEFHPTRWPWFKHLFYGAIALVRPEKMFVKYGYYLRVPKSDRSAFQYFLWSAKCYEPQESELAVTLLNDGDIAIDIGANIGYYSCLFSKQVNDNGMVYAFEPEQDNFRQLKDNLSINNIRNVYPQNTALSNIRGKSKLYISDESAGEHSLLDIVGDQYQVVSTDTLDNFISTRPELLGCKIKLVKIDVEGCELKVLEGMSESLSRSMIENIILEYSPNRIAKYGGDPAQLFSIIGDNAEVSLLSSTNSRIRTVAEVKSGLRDLVRDKFSFFYFHIRFPDAQV
jgi:FkbM family methyltransferase